MQKYKKEIINYLFILWGSLIVGFGIIGFLSPNHIATGGTAGLAIVLNHVIPLPIGVLMGLINVPLLIMSMKFLGKKFAIKTIVCIGAIMLSTDLLMHVIKLPAFSNELLLATLYGGVVIGIGLGFIFKGGGSAGGGTILAKIISARSSVKTSTAVLILDTVVVASAGFAFKSVELALWSLISIYVTSKLIDVILVGAQSQKIVHISSRKNLSEMSKLISDNLGISGTIIKGNDLGNTEFKDIIFLMIDKSRINTLKQLVVEYDSEVKMIVMEATEVLGN